MSVYAIFSRGVRCPFPLVPGWESPGGDAEVLVEWGPEYTGPCDPAHRCRFVADGVLEYIWPGEARYLITAERIGIHPIGERRLPEIRESLLGPILAYCMHLRSDLVLHAAGLETPAGEGVILIGHSGKGKSTLSARALAMGARLVNEDVVILRQERGGWWMQPGWPVMRLEPQLAASVPLTPMPEIAVSGSPKEAFRVPGTAFATGPVPLQRIVMLGRGRNARRELPVGEGIHALIELSYTLGLFQEEALKHYFRHFMKILRKRRIAVLASEPGEDGIAWSLGEIMGTGA